ncbi:thioredoxin-like 4, chloroplastic [Dioscorea cayenensis subsp. rotundata]|uniref:Thioredoxin-like 4, chloroplastic n=1 Tax=Dioscorea cayennensis subsp. rotundata TaxID=55577 RepID=A0AB40CYQ8_DIOCR|nr:thioredoxin-like 4, chloroplastic [Dioscorea cayenensis subsp. rotundata]
MRNFLHSSSASTSVLYPWLHPDSKHQSAASSLVFFSHPNFLLTIPTNLNLQRISRRYCLNPLSISDGNGGLVLGSNNKEEKKDDDDDDDDAELCPVDCVKEFKTEEEFLNILEKSKETGALVVVDFFRPSCGSCKYIEQGFMKLCKGSGDQDSDVVFLKHNVIDEYDEQSEVADRLRIKIVPLFHFYKNGVLLEAFPTRDKEKIMEAIQKYTSSS